MNVPLDFSYATTRIFCKFYVILSNTLFSFSFVSSNNCQVSTFESASTV